MFTLFTLDCLNIDILISYHFNLLIFLSSNTIQRVKTYEYALYRHSTASFVHVTPNNVNSENQQTYFRFITLPRHVPNTLNTLIVTNKSVRITTVFTRQGSNECNVMTKTWCLRLFQLKCYEKAISDNIWYDNIFLFTQSLHEMKYNLSL